MHRQFFGRKSQNRDFNQTFCNDRRNPFHFACRQWYSFNNPTIRYSIITLIQIQILGIIIRILVQLILISPKWY